MNENLVLIWEKCLQFMRDNLNAAEDSSNLKKLENSFDLLFDKVQPVSLVDNNLTLMVPSDFYKEYIEDNYLSLLSAALKKYIGKGVKLWYQVMENKPAGKEKPITVNVKGKSTPAPKPQETMPQHFSSDKIVNPFVVPGIQKINIDSNLKADFSFDSYVEGESNKFASTVAKSIAKRPGATAFNPLFLHGGYGVGKTHLGHAIGLEVKNTLPDKVVLYLSSEKFIQQFVSAAKAHKQTEFANFYQMVDVLIIDDIQFLSGKSATQDSFFHIFDYLHQNGMIEGHSGYGVGHSFYKYTDAGELQTVLWDYYTSSRIEGGDRYDNTLYIYENNVLVRQIDTAYTVEEGSEELVYVVGSKELQDEINSIVQELDESSPVVREIHKARWED